MGPVSTDPLNIRIDEKDLPVLSQVATRAIAMINSGTPDTEDLEKLIRMDQSLTVQILRLANSPVFGGKVKISSLSQAVVRLGLSNLKTAILAAASGEVFDKTDPYARALWEHSIGVAFAAGWLAERLKTCAPDEAFVAGMLHDVGKLVIYAQEPDFYGTLIEEAAVKGKRFYEYEHSRINFTNHESVGGLVARKWELPTDIIEAIRFHHDLEEDNWIEDEDYRDLVATTSVANLVANHLGMGAEAPSLINVLESVPGEYLGFDEALLTACESELLELLEEQKAIFS